MDEVVIVKVVTSENSDGAIMDKLLINGKEKLRVYPLYECPEDAIIGRDLISCGDIASFLEDFLKANQGKKVKFEYEEVDREEF
jgi:hypothetical protein